VSFYDDYKDLLKRHGWEREDSLAHLGNAFNDAASNLRRAVESEDYKRYGRTTPVVFLVETNLLAKPYGLRLVLADKERWKSKGMLFKSGRTLKESCGVLTKTLEDSLRDHDRQLQEVRVFVKELIGLMEKYKLRGGLGGFGLFFELLAGEMEDRKH